MTFKKFDVGAAHRTTKAQDGDCQVRALCTATSLSYNEAWDLLYKVQGETRSAGFRLTEYLKVKPETFGVVKALSFPAKRGVPRMTGKEFVRLYPKGRYILRLAHHVAAVVDGVVIDSWDSTRKCVYGAWQLKVAS